MKLYQFAYSPYAAKVRKCLELKGIAFDLVDVPYLDRRELIALTNGWIQVPVLLDGSTVVTDSPRITAYLDEHYAPSLRPGPLVGPASALEQWADQVLEDVAFRLAAPPIETLLGERTGRRDAAAMYRFVKERKFGPGCLDQWQANAADLSARLTQLLWPLGKTLESQPFLLGERPTVADAAVYGNFAMMEWALPGRMAELAPAMSDWYRRVDAARDLGA